MLRQKQLTPRSCLQACIANALGLDINTVPDWSLCPRHEDTKYPVFWIEMQDWLRRRGFALVEIEIQGRSWMPVPYPFECLIVGLTGGGTKHMILGRMDQESITGVFDPLSGLEGEDALSGLTNVTGIAILAPVAPATLVYTPAPDRDETLLIGKGEDDLIVRP